MRKIILLFTLVFIMSCEKEEEIVPCENMTSLIENEYNRVEKNLRSSRVIINNQFHYSYYSTLVYYQDYIRVLNQIDSYNSQCRNDRYSSMIEQQINYTQERFIDPLLKSSETNDISQIFELIPSYDRILHGHKQFVLFTLYQ